MVYKAKDTRLGRTVALKFLAPQLTSDPDLKKRFVQEAKAASALDHPNIGVVHDINETEDGQLFITMAYYEGETLKDKIAQGPIPVDQAIDYAAQIAKGLAKAHEADIVHRDIKPANIIITKDDTVKIVDFGLAKMTGETQLTKTGSTIGTIAYMSPEQLKGEEVNHRTDIWSLGVVLYEMVMGERPYKGEYEHQIIYQVLHDEVDLSDVPEAVRPFLQGTLQKNPEERYVEGDGLLDLHSTERLGGIRSSKKHRKVQHRRRFSPAVVLGTAVVIGFLSALIWWTQTAEHSAISTPSNVIETRLTYSGKAFAPAISPDGEVLAFYEATDDTTGRIMIQEIPSGRPFELLAGVDFSTDYWSRAKIEWSPDGRFLGVRTRERDTSGTFVYQIHIYSRLGQYIKSIPASNDRFDWSPDATSIAIFDNQTVQFVDIESLEHRTAELPFFGRYIDWSPDGERIVLNEYAPELRTLWVVDKHGLEATPIFETKDEIALPTWGPRGDRIYFFATNGITDELRMLPVSTTTGLATDTARVLYTIDGFSYESSIALHADRLVFEKALFEPNFMRYHIDGTSGEILNSQYITDTPSSKWAFELGKEGHDVTFLMQNPMGADLYSVSIDGDNLRQLTFTHGDIFTDIGIGRVDRVGDMVLIISSQKDEDVLHLADVKSGQITSRSFEGLGYYGEFRLGFDWDGKSKVVFEREEEGNIRFVEYDLLTEDLHLFPALDTLSWISRPRYSPDGSQIAFVNKGIRVYTKNDSTMRHLYKSASPREALYPLRWSLDGKWIYASTDPSSTGTQSVSVVKISATEGKVVPIASIPGTACTDVDISSDGTYIVASEFCSDRSDIYMLEGLDPDVE